MRSVRSISFNHLESCKTNDKFVLNVKCVIHLCWQRLFERFYAPINIVACKAATMRRPRDVSRQRLGKHIPVATNRRATMEVLLETGCFYVVRAEELSWRLLWRPSEFCTGGYEERTWAREAEESPLLEAVVRERLVKTQQAGKGLMGAARCSVNCED
jgi:hypothetical protein